MGPADLAGRRILIVEDEFVVALQLEQLVRAAGGTVVGPVPSVERALPVVRTEELDGALLDVNLHGRPVTPVARALRARGIPFILVTAYGRAAMAEAVLRAAPRVDKATVARDLGRVMTDVFGTRGEGPRPRDDGRVRHPALRRPAGRGDRDGSPPLIEAAGLLQPAGAVVRGRVRV